MPEEASANQLSEIVRSLFGTVAALDLHDCHGTPPLAEIAGIDELVERLRLHLDQVPADCVPEAFISWMREASAAHPRGTLPLCKQSGYRDMLRFMDPKYPLPDIAIQLLFGNAEDHVLRSKRLNFFKVECKRPAIWKAHEPLCHGSNTVASVKVRTSPVTRGSPYIRYFYAVTEGVVRYFRTITRGSVRYFRTVTSVVHFRVIASEVVFGVNFLAARNN
jgi:hypothetical protein